MSGRNGLRVRDRRALVWGGALIAGMFFIARVLPSLVAFEERLLLERDRISRESSTARLLARESLSLLQALDSTTTSKGAATVDASTVLRAPTAAEASAILLTRVSGLAEFAGASVLSAAAAGDSAFRDEYAEVGARLSLALDDVALVKLVSALEADQAHLAVLSLHVVRSSPSTEGPESRALRAELLVGAIARRELRPTTDDPASRVAAH